MKLIDNFIENLKIKKFENSIKDFETEVNSLNLSSSEFSRYSDMANAFKILNDKKPDLMDNTAARNGWACAWAIVVWVAALISVVAGCITVFLCVVALIGFATATVDYVLTCCPEPGDC